LRAVRSGPVAVLLGFLGVLGFSFTLPATRLALEGLDATFVGVGRAAVAAVPAALLLLFVWRERRPTGDQLRGLVVVALGVVFGFPLLSALALRELTAAHSAVIVGLLPAATAVMAVARAGERPSPAFWAASGAGLLAVLTFAATQGAGLPSAADLLVLGAVGLCALGYAEGGRLSRDLGGSRVICWALVLSFPIALPVGAVAGATGGVDADAEAWLGFAYVSAISMFLAFFAWYAGLARGGVAKIGQVQLMQPLLTLVWAAALLGEHVDAGTIAAAVAVLACVVATQRTRVVRRPLAERLDMGETGTDEARPALRAQAAAAAVPGHGARAHRPGHGRVRG
jgi:drug/metabolite transporter (DMT)-like permease